MTIKNTESIDEPKLHFPDYSKLTFGLDNDGFNHLVGQAGLSINFERQIIMTAVHAGSPVGILGYLPYSSCQLIIITGFACEDDFVGIKLIQELLGRCSESSPSQITFIDEHNNARIFEQAGFDIHGRTCTFCENDKAQNHVQETVEVFGPEGLVAGPLSEFNEALQKSSREWNGSTEIENSPLGAPPGE